MEKNQLNFIIILKKVDKFSFFYFFGTLRNPMDFWRAKGLCPFSILKIKFNKKFVT